MKGFIRGQLPTAWLNGQHNHFANPFKYLGITVGSQLTIARHIQALTVKTNKVFTAISRAAHSTWGLKFPSVFLYYRTIFLAIISYGAASWSDLITSRHRRDLLSLQRQILLRIAKAYCTDSTVALQVLAGVLPLDLHLRLKR